MTISRRTAGLGLLALGAAGAAGALAAIGPKRLRDLVTWRAFDQATLWGFIGGEKLNLVNNQKIQELLQHRYGITLDARRAGSVEMVSDPAVISQHPQWLWPADAVLVDLARRNGLPVRREEPIFNSPLVLYSWTPIVEALLAAGYVEQREKSYYVVKMAELMQAISDGLAWRDVGVDLLYGRVIVTSTDPAKSNSGFSFAALLANLFAGGVATSETLARDLPNINSIFARMGYKEGSSGTLWNSFLNEGMGGKPLIVGYESQLIEFMLADPERWNTLQTGSIRPVLLYPIPTVSSSHPIVSLTEAADRLIPALTDPEFQELAWSEHGFRKKDGNTGKNGPTFEGLAPLISRVVPIPDANVMLALVERLSAPS
jgi:hypothetical protein